MITSDVEYSGGTVEATENGKVSKKTRPKRRKAKARTTQITLKSSGFLFNETKKILELSPLPGNEDTHFKGDLGHILFGKKNGFNKIFYIGTDLFDFFVQLNGNFFFKNFHWY